VTSRTGSFLCDHSCPVLASNVTIRSNYKFSTKHTKEPLSAVITNEQAMAVLDGEQCSDAPLRLRQRLQQAQGVHSRRRRAWLLCVRTHYTPLSGSEMTDQDLQLQVCVRYGNGTAAPLECSTATTTEDHGLDEGLETSCVFPLDHRMDPVVNISVKLLGLPSQQALATEVELPLPFCSGSTQERPHSDLVLCAEHTQEPVGVVSFATEVKGVLRDKLFSSDGMGYGFGHSPISSPLVGSQ